MYYSSGTSLLGIYSGGSSALSSLCEEFDPDIHH